MTTRSVSEQAAYYRRLGRILARVIAASSVVATAVVTAYWAPLGEPGAWHAVVTLVLRVLVIPGGLLVLLESAKGLDRRAYRVMAAILWVMIGALLLPWAWHVAGWAGAADPWALRLGVWCTPMVGLVAWWLRLRDRRRELLRKPGVQGG
ncbi:hypothetical protein [Verrucosispora sp. TAA-831]|uniref:hypothetical protein n=1 Tax=Verrucosispora sp. TAA-831 TaxID=3422227 RepID=UPI003D6F599B